jgi:hypothetical protein
MLFPLQCEAGADALSKASPRKFATPTRSRKQIMDRRRSALPSLSPDQHSDDHPKLIIVDSSSDAESVRFGAPISCEIEEPPRCWTPGRLPSGRDAEDLAELVDANRLFAHLALHHVRPRHCSVADEGKQTYSYEPHLGCGSVSALSPPSTRRCCRAIRIVQSASPNPPQAPIETLFAELARRRLRSLATKESSR